MTVKAVGLQKPVSFIPGRLSFMKKAEKDNVAYVLLTQFSSRVDFKVVYVPVFLSVSNCVKISHTALVLIFFCTW